jgi:MHS family proline/betaine transporter-like MFS transporter
LIAFIGFHLRRNINEEHLDQLLKKRHHLKQNPLLNALKNHLRSVLATIGIVAFSGIMYNVSFSYVSIYLTTYHNWPLSKALFVMSLGMVVYILFAPLSGLLSDKYGEKKVMISAAVITILSAYPCFVLLTQSQSLTSVVLAQMGLAILAAWFQGSMNLLMPKLFPMESRYSGLGFSYGLGIGLFGGTTAMISTILMKSTGNPLSPLLYLLFGGVLGLLGVIFAKPKKIEY